LRLDRDKSGTLNRIELEEMTDPKLTKKYNIDWPTIIDCCDYNGDGVIDFQEFISACIDRKVLSNQDDVRKAFKIMDTNADGTLSLDDFDDLFNSYGGAKMDTKLWDTLLMEADKNGDGVVSL
jgi:Ca2+-binding EF-hand superfamily protein